MAQKFEPIHVTLAYKLDHALAAYIRINTKAYRRDKEAVASQHRKLTAHLPCAAGAYRSAGTRRRAEPKAQMPI
jgi:hypothetical protein